MNDHYTKYLDDWKQAGKIASEALAFGKSLIKEGASVIEICDAVDEKILELGAKPAFPSQISLNSIAAHFCPGVDDTHVLSNEVVSLDCGAMYNGAIGDNAVTVDLSGEYEDLVQASRDALQAAISTIKPGAKLFEIGQAIEQAIKAKGFLPVVNLSGHGLDYNTIHSSPSIPNYNNGSSIELEEGMIFAVEPFASTGAGKIHETGEATIFSLLKKVSVRSPSDRLILTEIETYAGRPFTTRYLSRKYSAGKVRMALSTLRRLGALHAHPPLSDENKGIVSQAEHTVLVTSDGCEVLTKND